MLDLDAFVLYPWSSGATFPIQSRGWICEKCLFDCWKYCTYELGALPEQNIMKRGGFFFLKSPFGVSTLLGS